MERPNEIVWFERIYLGTLALGLIQSFIAWPEMVKLAGTAFVITTQLFVFGLIGGLTLLTSRRRSNVAKWVLIALYVVGLPLFIKQLIEGQLASGSPVISIIQALAQLLAFALLFTPAAKDWFRSKSAAQA